MNIQEAIENSVIESIFERGWVEQSPEQFITQCKMHLEEELQGRTLNCSEESLEKMILKALMRHLGEDFDINLYRLQFFPALSSQEYDI